MSFDRLARYYPGMEMLLAGGTMHRGRTAFLDQIPPPGRILLPGEGHGRTLEECRRRFPAAHITCVDASARMLARARRQLIRHQLDLGHIQFVHADLLTWTPPAKTYDLIVTHYFLDCFRPDQLARIIPALAAGATPDAQWLLADFQVAPRGLLRLRSRLILWSLYVFFRAVTRLPARELTPPDSYLKAAGFTLRRRRTHEGGLLHSDWWHRSVATPGSATRAGGAGR